MKLRLPQGSGEASDVLYMLKNGLIKIFRRSIFKFIPLLLLAAINGCHQSAEELTTDVPKIDSSEYQNIKVQRENFDNVKGDMQAPGISDNPVGNENGQVLFKYKYSEGHLIPEMVAKGLDCILVPSGFVPESRVNGLFIPALGPSQSLDLTVTTSGEISKLIKAESSYFLEMKLQILNGHSDYFAVFESHGQHENIYKTENDNQKYGGDAELYFTDQGIGLLGEYAGGNHIGSTMFDFRVEVLNNSDSTTTSLTKYIKDQYVGRQTIYQKNRFQLDVKNNKLNISFFCDNDSETLPCIVSGITFGLLENTIRKDQEIPFKDMVWYKSDPSRKDLILLERMPGSGAIDPNGKYGSHESPLEKI